jgi:hypothetical protein
MAFSSDVRDPEVVDLLQHLIRNACVNDGTEASGHERANADILRAGLEGSGCDLKPTNRSPAVPRWSRALTDARPTLRRCATSATPTSCR